MTLLPPNATTQERALEAAVSRPVETPLRALWNPQTCPEEILPWLAWAFSVDDWSPDWPLEIRRSVISVAINTHRTKGTRHSVVEAVNALGAGIAVREWFEETPRRPPHTFRAVLTLSRSGDDAITVKLQQAVINAIDRTKPVRSHYEVIIGINAGRRLPLFGFARPYLYKRIKVNATQ